MASSRGAHEAQQQRKQQHETLVAVLSKKWFTRTVAAARLGCCVARNFSKSPLGDAQKYTFIRSGRPLVYSRFAHKQHNQSTRHHNTEQPQPQP